MRDEDKENLMSAARTDGPSAKEARLTALLESWESKIKKMNTEHLQNLAYSREHGLSREPEDMRYLQTSLTEQLTRWLRFCFSAHMKD